ncbi:MAG: hypothetical protein AB7O91_06445 [Sphingomonas sp.]
MELLLALLSLLTAANGAVAGARAPEAGVHRMAAGTVSATPSRRAVQGRAALEPTAPRSGREAPVAVPAVPPPAAAPLATERLIE